MSTRCTATTNSHQPCRAWAVAGTEPPLCAAHGGTGSPNGAALGNQNAVKHGFYRRPARRLETVDDALGHLAESLVQLADYIDEHVHELTVDEIARLQAVRGQNLSRFVRMKRDQAALDGEAGDELQADIANALKLAGLQLGVELDTAR